MVDVAELDRLLESLREACTLDPVPHEAVSRLTGEILTLTQNPAHLAEQGITRWASSPGHGFMFGSCKGKGDRHFFQAWEDQVTYQGYLPFDTMEAAKQAAAKWIQDREAVADSPAEARARLFKTGKPCCERDHDQDGNCDRHPKA
jgi:hypothetical protein